MPESVAGSSKNPNCTHPPEYVMYVEVLGYNKCRMCGKRVG